MAFALADLQDPLDAGGTFDDAGVCVQHHDDAGIVLSTLTDFRRRG
jgi:hypothetical protein